MIRKIILPAIFAILTYGFWVSPDFKEIAAGVAIFLFGMLALEEGFKAFKETKHVQKNMSRYLTSDNEAIRTEYDQIRIRLANVLRKLAVVRRQGHDSSAILSLDSLKVAMREYTRELDLRLNTLIRGNNAQR